MLAPVACTGQANQALRCPASMAGTGFRDGIAELGAAQPPRRLPATSLNRPVGPRRRLDVVSVTWPPSATWDTCTAAPSTTWYSPR